MGFDIRSLPEGPMALRHSSFQAFGFAGYGDVHISGNGAPTRRNEIATAGKSFRVPHSPQDSFQARSSLGRPEVGASQAASAVARWKFCLLRRNRQAQRISCARELGRDSTARAQPGGPFGGLAEVRQLGGDIGANGGMEGDGLFQAPEGVFAHFFAGEKFRRCLGEVQAELQREL